MKKFLIAAAIVGLTSGVAQAQDGEAYLNAGGALFSAEGLDINAIDVKVGYNFMENLGAEVEGAIGIGDDQGVKLDTHFGGFLVGRLPAGENFDIFARVGYFSTELSSDFVDVGADGIAYGAGAQFFFTDNDGVRLEYTRLEDDGSADQFGVSYVRKF